MVTMEMSYKTPCKTIKKNNYKEWIRMKGPRRGQMF